MAASNILSAGPLAETSGEFTIADGGSKTLCLKGQMTSATGVITIELKDDEGVFHDVGQLGFGASSRVIQGGGTYRVSRPAGMGSGVFSG